MGLNGIDPRTHLFCDSFPERFPYKYSAVAKLLCIKDWTTRSRQRDLWKSLSNFAHPRSHVGYSCIWQSLSFLFPNISLSKSMQDLREVFTFRLLSDFGHGARALSARADIKIRRRMAGLRWALPYAWMFELCGMTRDETWMIPGPLTLVFHLPILTQTWPSIGKTVLHPFTFKCSRIKNQWLWAGRQKKLWLHSFERGRHWLHFQSPKWQFSMHHHAVPIDVDWLSSKTSFLLHHAVPIGCWPVIKLLTYLLTSEWPTSTDCSPKKEIPEKTSKA